ncbi:MAG: MoaD/ThiS family protein [Kineosporiaceae bacterium]
MTAENAELTESTVPVRVVLPAHLRELARVDGEVSLDVVPPVCIAGVLDAVEARYPVLCGAIRAHGGGPRRPFVRFFACQDDWSHEPVDAPLPAAVARGEEPLLVVGAMAGG